MACCKPSAITEHKTECVCNPDGYPFICFKHGGCVKTAHYHNLCRTRPEFREQWEAGKGPCIHDTLSSKFGLGDLIHYIIELATFGTIKACKPCSKRRIWLNRIQLWPINLGSILTLLAPIYVYIRRQFRL